MINVEHIEELMFDYFEGNLSPDKMKELELFVQDNPSFQVDFDSWKDSYVEKDDKKLPFAYTSLLAGTGAAWLKWAGVGLILIFVGYGTYTYLNEGSFEADSKTETAQNKDLTLDSESEMNGFGVSFDEFNSKESPLETAGNTPRKSGNDMSIADNTAGEEGRGSASNSSNNEPSAAKREGEAASLKNRMGASEGHSNAERSSQSYQKKGQTKPAKKGGPLTSQAFDGVNNKESQGKTKRFSFSKKGKNEEEHENLALAQAVDFFQDGSQGGANQFSYDGSFPSLNLSNRNSKKTGKESGLARLIRNISNGILPVQELGLRNFRDPYFIIPEFKSGIAQNGGYAGEFGGLRAKLSYRFMGDVHQATASFDTRIGKEFQVGAGGLITQNFYENAGIQSSKTDIALIVAPKIQINRDATFSPSVRLNVGRQSHMIKEGNFQYVELERGQLLGVSNRLESDTMSIGTINHDYVDFGLGGMLQTESFHLGIQVNNILSSSMSTDYIDLSGAGTTPMDVRVVLGTDYKYSDFSSTTFSPSIVLNQRGRYTDVWLGAYMKTGKLLIGANYGNHGEGAAMIGIQTPRMRFSLTGDYTKRYLTNEKAFSFGTSMRLFLGKRSKSTDLPQT